MQKYKVVIYCCLWNLVSHSIYAFLPANGKIHRGSFRSLSPSLAGYRSKTTSLLSSAETVSAETSELVVTQPRAHYDSIVCGGGPAGLLTAIMLLRKYGPSHRVAVCERRPSIPPSPTDETVWNDVARFYLLGIGHRGQTALRKFGVFDDFKKVSIAVNGRRDWQPGLSAIEDGKITPARKAVASRVLPRDKLVGVLHHHIMNNYAASGNIDMLYGYEVVPVSFGRMSSNDTGHDDVVSLRILKCKEATSETNSGTFVPSQESEQLCSVEDEQIVTTKLLIGADGSARTVANAMERNDAERIEKLNMFQRLFAKKPFKVTRYVDDNERVYKSIPIRLPPDWPCDLNYSARSKGNRITLEALPSDNKGNLCALLLMKPDDELAQANTNPARLRDFFNEEFPQFSALIDDVEMSRCALKPCSTLPSFRYAGPRLNMGRRTIVLGDAAHTVKPYYGLGANTALEDVCVLSTALDDAATTATTANENSEDIVPKAVKLFSDRRAGDSAALVQISRNMDRRGKLFFVHFVLPLILDGIFHKMAPKIFGPNMFGMFQKQGMGFKSIQRKKRLDRALQTICLGTSFTVIGIALQTVTSRLAQATGKSQSFVVMSTTLLVSAGMFLRKLVTSVDSDGKKATEQ